MGSAFAFFPFGFAFEEAAAWGLVSAKGRTSSCRRPLSQSASDRVTVPGGNWNWASIAAWLEGITP